MFIRTVIFLFLISYSFLACNNNDCEKPTCPSFDRQFFDWLPLQSSQVLNYSNQFQDTLALVVVEQAASAAYQCPDCEPDCSCQQFGGFRLNNADQNLLFDMRMDGIGLEINPPENSFALYNASDPTEDVLLYTHFLRYEPLSPGKELIPELILNGTPYQNVIVSTIDTTGLNRIQTEIWKMWIVQGIGPIQFEDRRNGNLWTLTP